MQRHHTIVTERRTLTRGPSFRTADGFVAYQRGQFTLYVRQAANAVPGRKTHRERAVCYTHRVPFAVELRLIADVLDRGAAVGMLDEAADHCMDLCVGLVRVVSRMVTERREQIAKQDHPEPPRAA